MLGIPVAELGPRMSARELTEWIAYERVTGPLLVRERIDFAAANIIAGFAAAMGGEGVSPEQFMPEWDTPSERPEQPVEDMIGTMRRIQEKQKEHLGDHA